ncbi:MAG: GDP-L-fucose synthase [Candidatus Omnitrophica bacterium]|nr:GDP-L-fucose synthase [Candidatus Omnitrophota bacterium]
MDTIRLLMEKTARIFIIGDDNVTGKALIRHLTAKGYGDVLTESACNLDLTDQGSVSAFLKRTRPEYVFFTHILSGGIAANIKYPAEFMYKNIQAQSSIIHYSYEAGVKKLLFVGSSCVYPRQCPQPMREEYLLSGCMEKTSEAYSLAKIAGIKMCEAYKKQYGANFVSCIPATVYGPDDHFDLEKSHVLTSLIRRIHEAKVNNVEKVEIWGTGSARREFLYAEDMADACIVLMDTYGDPEVINIGCGEDISIKELALNIRNIVGFAGEVVFDKTKPDGVFRKLLDREKISKLGWSPKVSLSEGISRTYKWYKEYGKQFIS